MRKVLPLCVVLVLIVPAFSEDAKVTKCYQCTHFEHDGKEDEGCKKNPPEDKYKVDCGEASGSDADKWQCIKVTGRIEIDEENHEIVQRYCRGGNYTTADCKETKGFHTEFGVIKRGKHCVCDSGDFCNAGATLSHTFWAVGAGLFGVALTSFHL